MCELLCQGEEEYEFPEFVQQRSKVVKLIDMWNVGELKWLCMILGMTNMESIWCIYCYLRNKTVHCGQA